MIPDLVDFRSPLPKPDGPRLVKVLPRSTVKRFSAQEHHCIATQTMAFVSPFPEAVKRPIKETTLLRNRVAAALADSDLIAHAEDGSSTAALESLVHEWGMPVEHLG